MTVVTRAHRPSGDDIGKVLTREYWREYLREYFAGGREYCNFIQTFEMTNNFHSGSVGTM